MHCVKHTDIHRLQMWLLKYLNCSRVVILDCYVGATVAFHFNVSKEKNQQITNWWADIHLQISLSHLISKSLNGFHSQGSNM